MILTIMALFLLFAGKNRMDSVSGVQEKLRIFGVNRLWNQEDCYKFNFYKQRIKLPQLQCILFRVAAGVG